MVKNIFSFVILLIAFLGNVKSQIPSYLPKDSLVGWWPFDGNLQDYSGNNNHGTNITSTSGGIYYAMDRFNKINSALLFYSDPTWSAKGPYIQVKNNRRLYMDQNYSINIWLKVSSKCENGELINKGSDWDQFFSRIQNKLAGIAFGVSGNIINVSSKIDTSNWIMVTMTRDNITENGKLYINGMLLDSRKVNIPKSNSSDLAFGLMFSGGTNGSYYPYQGLMDDIAIWNRAIDSTEIKVIFNGGISSISSNINPTNQVKLYPNPVKDNLVIDFGDNSNMGGNEVKITDALGRIVYSASTNNQSEIINLNTWAAKGIYFVKISDNNGNMLENRKIVIQ